MQWPCISHWRYFGSATVGHGRPEDGKIHFTDWLALSHGLFTSDSQFASECVLHDFRDQTGGGKMLWRTILLGGISGTDVEMVQENACKVTQLTHTHLRCVALVVAVNAAVHKLMMEEAMDPFKIMHSAFQATYPLVYKLNSSPHVLTS